MYTSYFTLLTIFVSPLFRKKNNFVSQNSRIFLHKSRYSFVTLCNLLSTAFFTPLLLYIPNASLVIYQRNVRISVFSQESYKIRGEIDQVKEQKPTI